MTNEIKTAVCDCCNSLVAVDVAGFSHSMGRNICWPCLYGPTGAEQMRAEYDAMYDARMAAGQAEAEIEGEMHDLEFGEYYADEPWDGFMSDAEADADVLRMAGMGTDEDYGDFGQYDDYDEYAW